MTVSAFKEYYKIVDAITCQPPQCIYCDGYMQMDEFPNFTTETEAIEALLSKSDNTNLVGIELTIIRCFKII